VIDRRAFVAGLVGTLLAAPRVAQAQVPGRVYRIGYLGQGSKASELADDGSALERLLRNLRALGYTEGTNLIVESRFADGRPEILETLAAQLVQLKPELIAVASVGLARAVLEHTKTIPVVALNAGELQAEPAVHSLAKPGGNLTGMQVFSPETMGKRLQLVQEIIPGLRRVAVLRGVPWGEPGLALYRDATAAAAAKLGIRVRFVEFETTNDLNTRFDEMASQRDEALLIWSNPHLNGYRKEIFDLTIQHRVPTISDVRVYPPELMVYAAKYDEVHREAATYVDRILKGAKPGDLPIGQARTFELIINLKTAKTLGLTIPPGMLLRADEVIQ
jgi:putative ABC transport system substrate-binding protein